MALKGSREIGKLELKVPFLRKGYLFPISKLKVSPDGEISKCGTLFLSASGNTLDAAGDPLRDGPGCSGIIYEALLHCT